ERALVLQRRRVGEREAAAGQRDAQAQPERARRDRRQRAERRRRRLLLLALFFFGDAAVEVRFAGAALFALAGRGLLRDRLALRRGPPLRGFLFGLVAAAAVVVAGPRPAAAVRVVVLAAARARAG